jgi:group I intron endonuclease
MKSGIYAWKLDGVYKYIGCGKDVEKRMLDRHRECPILYNAIDKYGYDSFEKVIISICKPNELRKLEIYYIKKFHTYVSEGGFNSNLGGGGPLEHSKETKQKISENHADMSGENHPNYGKHHSEETKQKMSIAKNGKNHPRFGKKEKNASSQYYGVYKHADGKYIYWQACIYINGKQIYIGRRKSEIEAAQLYNKYVIDNNLLNPLNF